VARQKVLARRLLSAAEVSARCDDRGEVGDDDEQVKVLQAMKDNFNTLSAC
jgi:hypothetical protein